MLVPLFTGTCKYGEMYEEYDAQTARFPRVGAQAGVNVLQTVSCSYLDKDHLSELVPTYKVPNAFITVLPFQMFFGFISVERG